jgi:hypothetical protein
MAQRALEVTLMRYPETGGESCHPTAIHRREPQPLFGRNRIVVVPEDRLEALGSGRGAQCGLSHHRSGCFRRVAKLLGRNPYAVQLMIGGLPPGAANASPQLLPRHLDQ